MWPHYLLQSPSIFLTLPGNNVCLQATDDFFNGFSTHLPTSLWIYYWQGWTVQTCLLQSFAQQRKQSKKGNVCTLNMASSTCKKSCKYLPFQFTNVEQRDKNDVKSSHPLYFWRHPIFTPIFYRDNWSECKNTPFWKLTKNLSFLSEASYEVIRISLRSCGCKLRSFKEFSNRVLWVKISIFTTYSNTISLIT